MHQMNDLDLWRQRRRDLLQEAEDEHLARRLLRAARPKKAAWIRSALLGRVHGRALEDARYA